MWQQLIALLTGGGLIVAFVGVLKFWVKRQGKEITAPTLRWIVYGLSFCSALLASILSTTINWSDPALLIQWFLAAAGSAQVIYNVVSGKLGMKKE